MFVWVDLKCVSNTSWPKKLGGGECCQGQHFRILEVKIIIVVDKWLFSLNTLKLYCTSVSSKLVRLILLGFPVKGEWGYKYPFSSVYCVYFS